jgi:aldehyde dehydrogenase (NAD+)
VHGGPDVAAALLKEPFDHIHFTGGTAIGRRVMAAAAQHLCTLTLELGGKSPTIVDATADIAAAAGRIVAGKFLNAGQTCIAPDYVLVHASRAAELVAALRAAVAASYGADEAARRTSPDYGRIVDGAHFDRIAELLRRTVAEGAAIAVGGETDAAERYVAPTVLTDVTPAMAAMQDEVFGPVLPVLTWEDEAEVVRIVRSLPKPLMMYVFTRDRAFADRMVARTSAGGTVINNVGLHYLNHDAPFGGVGESGMGACHGFAGFRSFSHERVVMRQGWPVTLPLFSAPYRGGRARLARWLLRTIQRIG